MLTIRPSQNAVFETIEQFPGYAKSKVKGFSSPKREKKFLKIRNTDHTGLTGKLEKIDLFEIKLPSIFGPPKIRKPISERKDHSVHPFPKLGSGHGVYVYQNKYFKYEGEWRNGLKHGQGKLEMSDGTYYSGQFTNGEIEGHGFKFFSHSKDEYTGHFVKGEMQGKGKMIYFDGSLYEGEWHRNKRNGYGIMQRAGPEIYEGSYFRGMKDGYGLMLYKNGDKYKGYWKNDARMGYGVLRFADGTIYDGEFMGDLFHGRGLIRHCSGVRYEGEWINGFPRHMASKIVIIVEEVPEKKIIRKKGLKVKSVPQPEKLSNMIIIHQGVAFKIKVECRNENDELIEEDGRELRLTAGFRYYPPRKSDDGTTYDTEENLEERPIETPFGYSVVPYPITDQIDFHSEELQDVEVDHNSLQASFIQEDIPETQITEEGHGDHGDHGDEENHKHKDDEDQVNHDEDIQDSEKIEEVEEENLSSSNEILLDPGVQSNVPLLPPVGTRRTHKGACQWEELHLAPAPPNYGPFIIKEKIENEKELKRSSSKKEVSSTPSFSRRKSLRSVSGKDMLQQFRQQKKKVLEEKYAKTGDYVLMVHDVTNPPYLEKSLAPAFLLLKLKQPEAEKKKENRSKWSTADLIMKSMKESLKSTPVS